MLRHRYRESATRLLRLGALLSTAFQVASSICHPLPHRRAVAFLSSPRTATQQRRCLRAALHRAMQSPVRRRRLTLTSPLLLEVDREELALSPKLRDLVFGTVPLIDP